MQSVDGAKQKTQGPPQKKGRRKTAPLPRMKMVTVEPYQLRILEQTHSHFSQILLHLDCE